MIITKTSNSTLFNQHNGQFLMHNNSKRFSKTKVYEITRNKNHKYEYFGPNINYKLAQIWISIKSSSEVKKLKNETFKVRKIRE